MIGAFGAIGDAAVGALGDEAQSGATSLATRLLRGDEVETVIIVEIANRPLSPTGVLPTEVDAIGALAIGDVGDLLSGAGADETLYVSDGAWCGRPDDVGFAHFEPKILLLDIGEWQEEIPYLPEQDRRATSVTATMRLANAEGAFDAFFGARTVDGLRMRAWITDDRDGYSADWIPVIDAIMDSLDPDPDEATLTPINVADLLESPALRGKYSGTGGQGGDARLAGKYVPLAFGDCFNVEPDLENFEDQIDRWTEGDLIALTAVRDRGAPLLWDGNDWPDYTSLRSAVVAPGYYTTALSIGRSKRGAASLGVVTGDISAPHDTTAEILLALASGAAGVPEERLDRPSFGALPIDKVDLYLKGDRQTTVAEVFDALLRPVSGWYGSLGSSRLAVGVVQPPDGSVSLWAIESHQAAENSIAVRKAEQPARWRIGVTGQRNWRPMSRDELVDYTENPDLTQEMWERLQREEETAVREDAGLKNRYRGALDSIEAFGAVRGFFSAATGAQAAADALFTLLSRPLRRVDVLTGLEEVFTRPGQAGLLTIENRLELSEGRPGLITRRSFSRGRGMNFSMLVIADGG